MTPAEAQRKLVQLAAPHKIDARQTDDGTFCFWDMVPVYHHPNTGWRHDADYMRLLRDEAAAFPTGPLVARLRRAP